MKKTRDTIEHATARVSSGLVAVAAAAIAAMVLAVIAIGVALWRS